MGVPAPGRTCEEDDIDTLWPREAPPTVKGALIGIFAFLGLILVNVVTVAALAPSGGVFFEDLLIAVGFVAIALGVARRQTWARFAGVAVAALFAFGALSQFQGGVPGLVKAVGVVQLAILVSVIVLLLVRGSSDWFRSAE